VAAAGRAVVPASVSIRLERAAGIRIVERIAAVLTRDGVAFRVEREGVELIADVMPRPPAVCGLYVQGVLRNELHVAAELRGIARFT
jgi:hypothetical protein